MKQELLKVQEELKKYEDKINTEVNQYSERVKKFNKLGWLFVLIGFIIACFGIYNFYTQTVQNPVKLSELGDFLGGTVASLWSLSGLFFIYVAFLGQQKQMLLQNLELQYSRFELKETRAEFAEQTKTNKLQRFENTFFSMLSAFKDDIKNITLEDIEYEHIDTSERYSNRIFDYNEEEDRKIRPERISVIGKKCFELLYYELKFHLKMKNVDENKFKEIRRQYIKKAYKTLLDKNDTILGQYNKTFIRIIKFIEKSEIEDKQFYFDVLRAQLSTFETIIIYYASITARTIKNLNYPEILREYDFYRHMRSEHLENKKDVIFYNAYLSPKIDDIK